MLCFIFLKNNKDFRNTLVFSKLKPEFKNS